MQAIEAVYTKFKVKNNIYKSKFRIPDNCHGAYELERLIPTFQKGFASRNIPNHLKLDKNLSVSFNQTIKGIQKFLK